MVQPAKEVKSSWRSVGGFIDGQFGENPSTGRNRQTDSHCRSLSEGYTIDL